MKNILYSLIVFSAIVLIALSYQLYLTELSDELIALSSDATELTRIGEYDKAKEIIEKISQKWESSCKILMAFQDHACVNSASSALLLAKNCCISGNYSEISDNLIYFTAILRELVSENIPSPENIL